MTEAYCAVQVPSMTVGGALWFTDLTVADPYYLLPIAASGVFLLTVELGAADGMQVCSPRRIACDFLRCSLAAHCSEQWTLL